MSLAEDPINNPPLSATSWLWKKRKRKKGALTPRVATETQSGDEAMSGRVSQQPRGPGGALPSSVSRGSPGDSRPAGSKPLGSVLERPSKDLAVEQAPGGNLLSESI